MVRPFGTSEPETALRAYLYLIGCAEDRRSVTYAELARQVKLGGLNLLAKPLDLITKYCKANELPALASLVVEQATRLPAPGFDVVSRQELPAEQERVWDYDWFAIHPPALEELT